MGAVDLAGALADPRPVGRTEVDPALLVLAQHRQLVVEQQHLVAGPDRRGIRLLPGRGVPAQVAHDVARRRIALENPLRIGPALLGMGLAAVDHVAAIDRQGLLADLLVRLGTRLGVLPAMRPTRITGRRPARRRAPASSSSTAALRATFSAWWSSMSSAQSPHCTTSASPRATRARVARRARMSPARISAGLPRRYACTSRRRDGSPHSGCCSASQRRTRCNRSSIVHPFQDGLRWECLRV